MQLILTVGLYYSLRHRETHMKMSLLRFLVEFSEMNVDSI